MMAFLVRAAVCAAAAAVVSGCGGAGGPLQVGGNAMNYQPVYAAGPADTTTQALTANGITGTLVLARPFSSDVDLTNAKVRLSADRATAFLSIDGGAEVALAVNGPASAGGGVYGDLGDPNGLVLTLANLPDTSLIGYTRGTLGGFGILGIETRPARLPASASYAGGWNGFVYPVTVSGTSDAIGGGISLDIDFAGGDVTGTLDNGGIDVATIGGTVDGNGISGGFDFTRGKYRGQTPFVGKAFGHDADTVAGVFGNTVRNNVTGETQNFSGTFSADR